MAKIEIYVKGENGKTSSSLQLNSEPITAQQVSDKIEVQTDISSQNKQDAQGVAIASMMATKTLSYATSNVGKWTGNSKNQDRVNMLQQGVGLGITALYNPFLAVASAGIQLGTTAFEGYTTNRLEEQRSAARKLRAGYYTDDKVLGGRK